MFLNQITRCQILPVDKAAPPESYLDIEIVADPDENGLTFWNILTIATLQIIPSKTEETIELRINLVKNGHPTSHQVIRRERSVWYGIIFLPAMPFYPSLPAGQQLVLIQVASDAAAYLYAQEPKRLRQDVK
ncbi:MAG: hypothetical protein KF789_12490 [Bdellovibrionaceae bacterium]|nr:hypothetical protein [Pseudobdellovibrionaceae bacterium]